MPDDELKKILKKYEKEVAGHVEDAEINGKFSQEYTTFRKEALAVGVTRYERWCKTAEGIIQFKPSPKETEAIEQAIKISHLNITPIGAASFAALVAFACVILGLGIAALGFLFTGDLANTPIFFPFLFLILGLVLLKVLTKLPVYLAARWRLKASNQMVLCILYIVIYMRHTSNLENAIKFATNHIGTPLSLDLRKIFWDVETRKYTTIKESLDRYLESWRKDNLEFVTSIHLIESSLFEPTEQRRLELLDKALDVILEGTYEKMLHYAQELKSPITTLHMLGVILPILGLVVFPLLGSFLQGLVQWYHLAFVYNILLPIFVLGYGLNILSKRPTGYGESTIAEEGLQSKFNPAGLAIFLGTCLVLVGLFPLIIHWIDPSADLALPGLGKFFDYKIFGGASYGPFGVASLLISFFIPGGLALALGLYFKWKTAKLIKVREETKALEKEFSAALFQLGNRIGDGVPAEIAFNKVAQTLSGTPSGKFFQLVDTNIRVYGMSLNEAIFNKKNGAILSFPSPLIESSMEVLVESAKKGPKVVASSLVTISNYLERITRVNERLKDLLAEVISSMKAQISFLTPAIAGIVVGISAMIVSIIATINDQLAKFAAEGVEASSAGQLSIVGDLFKLQHTIPGYFFQLVVGLFVFELAYILTVLENGVENGNDKVGEQATLAKNLIQGTFLYIIIAAIVTIAFYFLSKGFLAQGGSI